MKEGVLELTKLKEFARVCVWMVVLENNLLLEKIPIKVVGLMRR